MPVESDGKSRGNPRIYEIIEHAPKTGKSPTVWAWPQLIDYLKVAGQPVSGPWPPHQEPRPDPDYESGPVAVADPHSARTAPAASPAADGSATQASATQATATQATATQASATQGSATHGATAAGGPAAASTAEAGTAEAGTAEAGIAEGGTA